MSKEEFMQSNPCPVSKKQLWAGRITTGLPALFLLVDGVMKLIKPAPVAEGTVKLGQEWLDLHLALAASWTNT
jgi:hypothetical protein